MTKMSEVEAVSTTASEVQVTVDAPAESAPKAGLGDRKPSLKRGMTKSAMSVDKMVTDEPKTAIDKAVLKRIAMADANGDGQLDKEEVVAIVKDLVLENRSKTRYGLISCLVTLLLIFSLVANFALGIYGSELAKETHAATIKPVSSTVASESRRRALRRVLNDKEEVLTIEEEVAEEPEEVVLTSKDGKKVMSMAPATTKVPLYVAAVLPDEQLAKGEFEIKYEVLDYKAESKPKLKIADPDEITDEAKTTSDKRHKRKLSDDKTKIADKLPFKQKTLKVVSVEKLSDTHIILKGADGEEVELDGGVQTVKTEMDTEEVLGSPLFGGTKTLPIKDETKKAGKVSLPKKDPVTGRRLSAEKTDKFFETKAAVKVPMKLPVLSSATIELPLLDVDVEKEAEELEEKAVDALKLIGIPVDDKKKAIDTRRKRRKLEKEGDKIAKDFDEDSPMKAPKAFEKAEEDVYKLVLEPVVSFLAESNTATNAASDECTDENPSCNMCVDNTLGCQPIVIEHTDELYEAETEDVQDGDSRARRARRLETTDEKKEVRKSTLFVSEKVGSASSPHQEMFMDGVGICGVKSKVNKNDKIVALAFRGCNSASFSDWYGLKGRAQEQTKIANDPEEEEEEESESVFVIMENEESDEESDVISDKDGRRKRRRTRRRKLDTEDIKKKDGIEDTDTEHENNGKVPFNAFAATTGTGAINSLTLTSNVGFTDEYKAFADEQVHKKMGAGGDDYPPKTKESEESGKLPMATLGTRVVGCQVSGDAAGLTSVSFIFKDDCSEKNDDLDEYRACHARVKTAACNPKSDGECDDTMPAEDTIKTAAAGTRRE